MKHTEPTSTPKAQDVAGVAGASGKVALGMAATALSGIAALPQAFEQYPYGAAVVVTLALYGGGCWMYWARMKYRRR